MSRPRGVEPADEMAELLETRQPYIPSGKRQCDPIAGCGQVKDVGEFYTHGNGKSGKKYRKAICRDCENTRVRPMTPSRAIRNRARGRASQRLVLEFPELFNRYYAEELRKAEHESAILQAIGANTVPEGESVRLKPGPKREGQQVIERIDVARCKACHTHHDRGHVCPNCGSTEEES